MVNIYIPVCGLFLSFLIFTIFTSKKNVKTTETKLFTYLIFANFLNAILTVVIIYFGYKAPNATMLFIFLNRIDFITYIIWVSSFFLYIYHISFENKKESFEKIKKNVLYVDAIVYFLTIILPVHIYNNGNMYSYGPAVTLLYSCVGIYMILILITSIMNYKKLINKKYIPLFALIAIILFTMFIRKINPGLLIISSVIAYINLIMYFTIENPDMKLLEEVHKSKEISDTANEEKTMFLYNMTQEIRNITSKIDDDADIILGSKELEVAYDSARDIKSNTSKFTSMTNEILDVSNVDSETIKTYNNKYDIKNTLKQIVNIYNDECKKKMLDFRTNIDHDIPDSLYGDSISLKESLNKILRNSLNNTNTGYIEFNVNTIIKNDICRLIITIEDSSNGIQSEELNTIKNDNKLLSEANSLIGVMQGTLMISSDYGVGTKIKVILDQKIVDSEETKEVTKYVNTLDNVNVLVCDTESGLKVISKLLDDSNIKLDKVDNGKELLETVKENKYDLVLMDESTSTNNQILVSKMKSIRNFNSEIILLTRDNSYEYSDEYKNLGFDDYILKPLKKDILLEKINKYKD